MINEFDEKTLKWLLEPFDISEVNCSEIKEENVQLLKLPPFLSPMFFLNRIPNFPKSLIKEENF